MKTIALVYIYQMAKFRDLMGYGSKDIFKYIRTMSQIW